MCLKNCFKNGISLLFIPGELLLLTWKNSNVVSLVFFSPYELAPHVANVILCPERRYRPQKKHGIKDEMTLNDVFQRFYRWRKGRGAKAGEGWRDQHFLCSFRASVWEIPQVRPLILQTWHPCLLCTKTLLIGLLLCSQSCPNHYFHPVLLPSKDYDAVCSKKHQNACQVLVPEELSVPNFQGWSFFFFCH